MNQANKTKEQLEFLKTLQILDKEIYALNREKNAMPERIKTIEEALESKQKGLKEVEEKIKNLQVNLKEKEVNLQQKEDAIKKLQTQLYQLKTNKEYSAMLSEIESLKADNSIIEEEIIKSMEEIDSAKKKMAEEKELFRKEGTDAEKEKDVISARVREIDSRLSGLYAQRVEAAPNIEKQILARYERVLKNREGLALVPVEDGACGGCHMNLPAQIVSEVRLKENIIFCGSCARILYIDDDVKID